MTRLAADSKISAQVSYREATRLGQHYKAFFFSHYIGFFPWHTCHFSVTDVLVPYRPFRSALEETFAPSTFPPSSHVAYCTFEARFFLFATFKRVRYLEGVMPVCCLKRFEK